MGRFRTSRWSKLLAITISAAMTLVLLDIGSHIVLAWRGVQLGFEDTAWLDTGKGLPRQAAADPVLAPHPFLGYVLDPDSDRDWSGYGGMHVNELGFLDDASPLRPKEDGELVVVITGGSVAHWLSILGADALRADLHRLLPHHRLRIVRLALGGYKQPQQLMALNWVLSMGAPIDVVVNLDGFNEVALPPLDLWPRNVHSSFPRDWNFLVQESLDPELLLLAGEVADLRKDRSDLLEVFRGHWPGRTAPGVLLWKVLDRGFEHRLADALMALKGYRSTEHTFAERGPPDPRADESAGFDELAMLWRRASFQMHAVCAAKGIAYVHCLQPNQYFAGSKPLSIAEKAQAFLADSPYRHAVEEGYPRLLAEGQWLSEHDVDFHDLTMLFQREPDTLYNDPCCHLNQHGNELLAHAIAPLIAKAVATPK